MTSTHHSLNVSEESGIPALVVLIFVGATIPLLLTPVIPAVDFNAHLLRYLILADDGKTAHLARNYSPDWKLLPNIGLDITTSFLIKIFPPLIAGKIVAGILLFSVYGGLIYLSHAIQGRIQRVSVVFSGFLMHTHIFTWGFANFLLGLGIGLAGLAIWLKTCGRPRKQLAIGIVIGAALMMVHALAFAVWGIMLAAFELGRAIERRDLGIKSLLARAIRLGSIAIIPIGIFLMSATVGEADGITSSFANIAARAGTDAFVPRVWDEVISRIDLMLRVPDSRMPWADRAVGVSLWAILITGVLSGALKLAPSVRIPALVAALMAAVVPPNLFGSGYVNDRFPLLLLCLLVAGLACESKHRLARPILLATSALLAVHLSLVYQQYWKSGRYFDSFIQSISDVDTGDIAGFAMFTNTGRDALSPICNPSLVLLALVNQTSVQTFTYASQQPLVLDGRLAVSMQKMKTLSPPDSYDMDKANPSVAWRQKRIAQFLDAGFDSVFVCDGAGPPPGTGNVRDVARGDFWAIYRRPASGK